jgi:hypothetical protein
LKKILDDKVRDTVALKKFSLIGPVLNNLVKNHREKILELIIYLGENVEHLERNKFIKGMTPEL